MPRKTAEKTSKTKGTKKQKQRARRSRATQSVNVKVHIDQSKRNTSRREAPRSGRVVHASIPMMSTPVYINNNETGQAFHREEATHQLNKTLADSMKAHQDNQFQQVQQYNGLLAKLNERDNNTNKLVSYIAKDRPISDTYDQLRIEHARRQPSIKQDYNDTYALPSYKHKEENTPLIEHHYPKLSFTNQFEDNNVSRINKLIELNKTKKPSHTPLIVELSDKPKHIPITFEDSHTKEKNKLVHNEKLKQLDDALWGDDDVEEVKPYTASPHIPPIEPVEPVEDKEELVLEPVADAGGAGDEEGYHPYSSTGRKPKAFSDYIKFAVENGDMVSETRGFKTKYKAYLKIINKDKDDRTKEENTMKKIFENNFDDLLISEKSKVFYKNIPNKKGKSEVKEDVKEEEPKPKSLLEELQVKSLKKPSEQMQPIAQPKPNSLLAEIQTGLKLSKAKPDTKNINEKSPPISLLGEIQAGTKKLKKTDAKPEAPPTKQNKLAIDIKETSKLLKPTKQNEKSKSKKDQLISPDNVLLVAAAKRRKAIKIDDDTDNEW